MTNTARKRGTSWESEVVNTLRAAGFARAERRRLAGSHDRGDVAGVYHSVGTSLVIECKNTKEVRLASWVDEADVEAANEAAHVLATTGDDDGALGVAWAHRRGRAGAGDGYVVMTGDTFLALLRMAGFR
jgi:hypothetical protein